MEKSISIYGLEKEHFTQLLRRPHPFTNGGPLMGNWGVRGMLGTLWGNPWGKGLIWGNGLGLFTLGVHERIWPFLGALNCIVSREFLGRFPC